jgi:mycofactocin precursor
METSMAIEPRSEAIAGQDLTVAASAVPAPMDVTEDDLVVEDLLVEDVSIDGMCGVY